MRSFKVKDYLAWGWNPLIISYMIFKPAVANIPNVGRKIIINRALPQICLWMFLSASSL